MNLSLNPTAEDDVNLVHATHLIQDSTEVASFLKNSGFEILESIEVSDGRNTHCYQISLNGSYISFKKRNNSDIQEFVDSALTGFGLGTKDIESTQGRLTLHGFHPLSIEERKLLFPVAKKSQREIACKVFKLKKSDVLEGDVEFIDVSTSTKSSAKSVHKQCIKPLSCDHTPHQQARRNHRSLLLANQSIESTTDLWLILAGWT